MAECPCSNFSIMQLFHQLKQQFPAVPDRVVTECIRQNGHNREACEVVLSRKNHTYSSPGGHWDKMAAEGGCERCRPDSLQLDDSVWDFNRRLLGRQSLDSLRCMRGAARRTYKRLSEEFLQNAGLPPNSENPTDENMGCFSRLSAFSPHHEDVWNDNQDFHQHCERAFENASDMHKRCTEFRCEESSISASDVKLQFASEELCHCERTRVSVVSYGHGAPHSAPVTPSGYRPPGFPPLMVDVTTQRHCTALNFEPTPHYTGSPDISRPFTSVNLTLRPPSSDPQPPIDISSGGGGLTYSSCSYDPRQGYQSRLQISIGPGGQGSVSAARTRPPRPPPAMLRTATSMPDVATTSSLLMAPDMQHLEPATQARLTQQLERKARLERELAKEKERLNAMQYEAEVMQRDLDARLRAPSSRPKVQKLRQEILTLQAECNRMTSEVDLTSPKYLPLGETNEEFYKHIYTGQLLTRSRQRLDGVSSSRQNQSAAVSVGVGGGEGPNWTCHVCTFRNHPLLDKCEQCEMPRIVPGNGETQNIHIHVTHHNFPSRRVLHSWVV